MFFAINPTIRQGCLINSYLQKSDYKADKIREWRFKYKILYKGLSVRLLKGADPMQG